MMRTRVPSARVVFAGLTLALVLGFAGGPGTLRAAAPNVPADPRHPVPPVPQPAETPVQKFRALLALNAAGREQALQGKTPWQQEYLRDQLRLFDALPAAEQEARLGLLQLRYYLLTLIRTAPTNRAERLQTIPEADRELIAERLAAWDALPPARQNELLQNEAVLSQGIGLAAGSDAQREAMLRSFPPARRQEFEASAQRWQALPEAQRARITRDFNEFFTLSPRQKQKALARVDESERTRIEQAVAAFGRLPPDERTRCLEALNRYAQMSPEERSRFLQNAARWQTMSAEERQTWRIVATRVAPGKVPPPRPPMPPPPMPPRSRKNDPAVTVTNAQVTK